MLVICAQNAFHDAEILASTQAHRPGIKPIAPMIAAVISPAITFVLIDEESDSAMVIQELQRYAERVLRDSLTPELSRAAKRRRLE